IQPATVLALPAILKELKARGYRIVHVVPATASRPKTPTTADAWLLHPHRKPPLPVISVAAVQNPDGDSLLKKNRRGKGDADAAEQQLRLAPTIVQHLGTHLAEPGRQLGVGRAHLPIAASHFVERQAHGIHLPPLTMQSLRQFHVAERARGIVDAGYRCF
ncbi:MAG: hypothetical protein WEA28_15140, partial [Xanthobacteraceae bacterium]